MNYPDFVRTLCKPGDAILNSMNANKAHLLHMGMGLMGEAVEFMKGFNENNLNNMIEELGDFKFFHVGLQNDLPAWQGEPKAEKLPVYDNCVLGLVYSAEQVLDSIKKYIIYDNPQALEKVHRNLYMAHCAYQLCLQLIPITDAEICDRNIAKLTTRYTEGQYSDASAKARADKKGKPDSPLTPKEVRLNPQQQAQEMLMATMLRNALQVDISGRMLQFVAGRISTRFTLERMKDRMPLGCATPHSLGVMSQNCEDIGVVGLLGFDNVLVLALAHIATYYGNNGELRIGKVQLKEAQKLAIRVEEHGDVLSIRYQENK